MLEMLHRLKKSGTLKRALVISEINVIKLAWPEEIDKWGYPLTYQVIHGVPREEWKEVDIYLLNCDYLSWVKRDKKGEPVLKNNKLITKYMPLADVLILDESTNFKSYSSQRFKKILAESQRYPRRYLLSATFFTKNHEDIWAQTTLLDGGARLGSRIGIFRDNYMKIKAIYGRQRVFTIATKEKGIEVVDKVKDLWKHFELPKKSTLMYQNRVMELSASEDETYKKLKTENFCYINEHIIDADNGSAKRVALRQLSSGVIKVENKIVHFHDKKINLLQQLIEELQGKNLLVVYNFNIELDILRNVFGKNIPVFKGGIKDSEREKITAKWNKGKLPLVFIQPQALSRGVNLQYGGYHICWFSPTDRWENYYQLNKRLDRIDQPHPVIVHNLIIKGTIDRQVYRGLINKEDMADSINLQLYEEI